MTPFLKIPDACKATGISQFALRRGCKDGTVPHIKAGTVYLIDVEALLEKLHGEALANAQSGGGC